MNDVKVTGEIVEKNSETMRDRAVSPGFSAIQIVK